MSRPFKFRPSDELLLPWHPNFGIDVRRAAKMLDCDVSTIRRMIQPGELVAFKKRPEVDRSPFHVSYDSVLQHIEKMHTSAGITPRYEGPGTDKPSR